MSRRERAAGCCGEPPDIRATIAAAGTGDVPALRRLIERRHKVTNGDAGQRLPIEVAVRAGHLEAVQILLDAGADPDGRVHGDTLIEVARDRGHEAIATILEEASVRTGRVKPSEAHADHPIHLAAEAGDVERVRELLDGDPALAHRGDRAGGTALHRAVIGRARRFVALLLERGADIHAIHGAGLGSMSGYAAQDLQPIDLALWSGPRTLQPSPFRMLMECTAARIRGPVRSANRAAAGRATWARRDRINPSAPRRRAITTKVTYCRWRHCCNETAR